MHNHHLRKVKRFCLACSLVLYVTANVAGILFLSGDIARAGQTACVMPNTVMMTNVTPDIHC